MLRRTLLLFVVTALLVLALASPASAKVTRTIESSGLPLASGNKTFKTFVTHCNHEFFIDGEGATVANKNGVHGGGDCEPLL